MIFSDIHHDPSQQLFTLRVDGEVAFISYVEQDGVLHLVHSEVPRHMRGQGVGKILVLKSFDYILEHGIRAKAVCSYIRAMAIRNPEQSAGIDY